MTTRTKEQSAVATAALAGNHGFSLISNEKLLELYTSMVKCRMIEDRLQTLSVQSKSANKRHGCAHHEAAAVGAAIDLLPGDTAAPSQRSSIVKLIEVHRLDRVIGWLLAGGAAQEANDCQLRAASDLALSNKIRKNGKIVAVFRRDETISTESWNQALSLADVEQLPMLFVSCSAAPARQESLEAKTKAGKNAAWTHGFPSIPVDGSDAVAVYRVATEAITHARKGNGATLIDGVIYPSSVRAETDPILKMEAYLTRKGIFSEELNREVADGFGRELDCAIEAARSAPSSDRSKAAINKMSF